MFFFEIFISSFRSIDNYTHILNMFFSLVLCFGGINSAVNVLEDVYMHLKLILFRMVCDVTKRICEVVENMRKLVKNNSKLINLDK